MAAMSMVGERRSAYRWLAGAVGLVLGFGSAVVAAPTAVAADGDLRAPLGKGPAGALVRGVWDDAFIAESDSKWYVSVDHARTWDALGSGDTAVGDDAWLYYLDGSHAVLGATKYDDENNVTGSVVWVVDLTGGAATVATRAVDGQVVGANPQVAVVTHPDGTSSAVDLATHAAVALHTEVTDEKASSQWALHGSRALRLSSWYVDGINASRTVIDPVSLDGAAGADDSFQARGRVDYARFTAGDKVEYITLTKTGGRSTYEVDYCTHDAAAVPAKATTCDVLKSGLSKNDSQRTDAWKVGDFAQFRIGGYLYFTELVRNPKTGKFPAAVKATGVEPDHEDGSHTEFARTGKSARPVVTDTSAGTGGVFEAGATGKAARISRGPVEAARPDRLSLAATRAVVLDERGLPHGAWQRDLGDFTKERLLSDHASDALVSVGRTAVNSTSGLVLTDHGRQTAKLRPWTLLGEMSGPYLLGFPSARSQPLVLVGSKLVSLPRRDYAFALFGSLVAAITYGTDSWWMTVHDVRTGQATKVATVDISDFQQLRSVFLWGDNIAVSGYTDADSQTSLCRITNFRTGAAVWSRTSADGAVIQALGDGAAVLELGDWASPQLLDLASKEITPLADAGTTAAPAFDGSNHVLYATDSELVVHEVPFAGKSAPIALWSSAPATFNSLAGESAPLRISVDATKPMAAGSLQLRVSGTSDVTATVPVAASTDGSLRVAWDGRLDDGKPLPAGRYDWSLTGFDGLRAIGGATVSGVMEVTHERVAYPQGVPTIDKTKPATGSVLTANPGSHPSDAKVGYQWYRGGKAIKGAAGQSYTAAAGDVGRTLKVKVSLTGSANYLNTSRYSKATAKVAKGTLVKGTATIGGEAPQVDVPYRVTDDGWGPDPVVRAYQWYRVDARGGAKVISKAKKAAYTPTGSDVGHRLKVVVTGSKPGYRSATVSVTSGAVLAGTYSEVPAPKVTGSPLVGRALVAVPGTYLAADGHPVAPALSFRWYRVTDGTDVAIKGATKATYKAAAADVGHPLTVKVVAKRSGYADRTTWSDPTDPVAFPD